MGSLQPYPDDQPRILYVDAFDSFSNNITGLLEQRLGARVIQVRIDDRTCEKNLHQLLPAVDAVVVGPGPGHPANPSDVGFINELWALADAELLPVLGICLGFQSLCLFHGADVKRLRHPRHGIVTTATHRQSDIFAGIGELEATQYHSLHADLGGVDCDKTVTWEPTEACPALCPLAWDVGDDTNGPILMAVRHTTKPFWGVQFHPESICTSGTGAELVANWWTRAAEWAVRRGRTATGIPLSKLLPSREQENTAPARAVSHFAQELRSISGSDDVFLQWQCYPAASNITPTAVLEAMGYRGEEVVVLDSQGHDAGRFDILGIVVPGQTMKVTYRVSDRTLRYGSTASQVFSTRLDSIDEVWPMFQEALDLHNPRNNQVPKAPAGTLGDSPSHNLPEGVPFWGGFMGYISYEAGLETIDVAAHASGDAPDLNFAFIHRSVVIDHATSHVYVQSLLPNDRGWILAAGSSIDSIGRREVPSPTSPQLPSLFSALALATTNRPSAASYRAKVRDCQTYLRSGDSYELCLTDTSTIALPSATTTSGRLARADGQLHGWPWSWYARLRTHNPAPHGAYLHLSGVHVLSASPERFLRWTRAGECEFRPIKGTVKKGDGGPTRAEAERILGTAKERAENLMIVDLIRHDLAGAVGAGNVWVSKLMEVEEFARVWHLVSVIQGRLSAGGGVDQGPRGIDVLRRSLPPGSMTGAPKKRSCEILNKIEGKPRGVYSGVMGYMDVGGGGDFSVVIRTAVRHGGHVDGHPGEIWGVGAGGAVTVQSTDEGEFLEMEAKASSVLDALFQGLSIPGSA